jgi:predicted RNase H-like nuclease (RuvC/YqgF family)
MSDDLVKRLRLGACALEIEQAADRIERLEAELITAEQRGYANAMEAERKLHEERIEERDDIIRHDRERIEELVSMVESKADRIEELEVDLRKMALDYLAAEGQAAEAYQAQLEAEAKLSRAVEGLQHYACDCVISCEQLNGSCGDMARTTLAELKGETDE